LFFEASFALKSISHGRNDRKCDALAKGGKPATAAAAARSS
jgi:hypothetical protein